MVMNRRWPQVMGILNVTPDSFSDGGEFVGREAAVTHALEMVAAGAAIIDVGGESTRPGAAAVSAEEELSRVVPVVEAIRQQSDTAISVDTSKPAVMQAAVAAGATLINDVRALQEPGALEMAASLQVPVCLMHMQGQPRTMQQAPHYEDGVVVEVIRFLQQRIAACQFSGIERNQIWVDPGFGFGKTLQHNLELLRGLEQFRALDAPLLVGISRKSMIGALLGDLPVEQRLQGSVGAAVVAVARGAAVVRVHDVRETVEALKGAGLMSGELGGA
jgi:dihydropteroate synthase